MIDDIVSFTDSIGPKGFIILKNLKTGEILVKKHNMIVKNGRKYLFDIFMDKQSTSNDGINYEIATGDGNLKNYKLNKLQFGHGINETIYESTGLENPLKSESEGIIVSGQTGKPVSESSYFKIEYTFKFEFNSSEAAATTISELGLFLTSDETTAEDKMFSRVTFDPVPINANTEFELKYYVYF